VQSVPADRAIGTSRLEHDHLIYLLGSGLTMATLLDLIPWRVEYWGSNMPAVTSVYNWVI
jgi:hypothetical protein